MSSAASGTVNIPGRDERLRQDIDALKHDFAALRDDLKAFAVDSASVARTSAAHAADRIRTTGREAYDSAKEKGKMAKEQVQGQIEDHPFMAVGIAFGAGLLIGALISRR